MKDEMNLEHAIKLGLEYCGHLCRYAKRPEPAAGRAWLMGLQSVECDGEPISPEDVLEAFYDHAVSDPEFPTLYGIAERARSAYRRRVKSAGARIQSLHGSPATSEEIAKLRAEFGSGALSMLESARDVTDNSGPMGRGSSH